MQVKQRLQLNAALSVIAAAAVILVLILSMYRVIRAVEASDIAGRIITADFERLTLRNDYVQSGSERARAQWLSKNEEIGQLLTSAAEKFRAPEDKMIVAAMIKDQQSIGRIFSAIVKNREKAKDLKRMDALMMETEERLLTQLNMRLYGLVLQVRGLQEASRDVLFSSFRLGGWGIACVLFLVFAAVIVNSWTMGRSITERIRRLRDGAFTIGGGNLDHRIEVKGADEFAELSGAFNAMTAKLQGSYRDLENEITERKLAEKSVAEHAARLEAINRELEGFSFSISHDLRAPLRAIKGFSRMILKKQGDRFDELTRHRFQVIGENAEKMGRLIDDMLEFSHLTRQDMAEGSLDMKELIEEVWQESLQVNPGRKMTLKIEQMPAAWGDRALIRQACGNLLKNAIKFTGEREAAVIEAGCYIQNIETVYYVRDNGIGFDMRDYDKLFSVYERLHSDNYEGRGMGLALVRRIIHRHGGQVWAEGKVGEGATFYFTLPVRTE